MFSSKIIRKLEIIKKIVTAKETTASEETNYQNFNSNNKAIVSKPLKFH